MMWWLVRLERRCEAFLCVGLRFTDSRRSLRPQPWRASPPALTFLRWDTGTRTAGFLYGMEEDE